MLHRRADDIDALVGLQIKAGFLREVNHRVGGTVGCTHLRELLQQMATTAFQTINPARAKREIDAKIAEVYRPRVPAGVKLVVAMRIGEAGQKILEYAQERDADLVVVGRQGAGAVGKILFGNVTERVVRKAPCPVLVIPPTPK